MTGGKASEEGSSSFDEGLLEARPDLNERFSVGKGRIGKGGGKGKYFYNGLYEIIHYFLKERRSEIT